MRKELTDTMHILNPLLSLFSVLLLPAALLLLGGIVLEYGFGDLSKAELGVLKFLPVVLLAGGLFVAFRFNRLRLYAALGNFLLVYGVLAWVLPSLDSDVEWHAVFGWLLLLAPLNHLATHILPDRGSHRGAHAAMLVVVGVETLLILLTAGIPLHGITNLLHVDAFTLVSADRAGLSDAGIVAIGIMLLLSFARLYSLVNTQRGALFVTGFCLLLVLAAHDAPATLVTFSTVAALTLAITCFQESWNIAYLDQLTELPGRRALDEAMMRLEGTYCVAMVDVDHFKQFNDTHGHDVGDQVLRMVATRLREVTGGGKAYRYGGEEFTVLFPGRTAKEAFEHVDELREKIGGDTFELRRRERRKDGKPVAQSAKRGPIINITVSAGLAERKGRAAAEDVIKAADEALYQAKHNGRNRVEKA